MLGFIAPIMAKKECRIKPFHLFQGEVLYNSSPPPMRVPE
jgi:hypothetical protein